MGSKKIKHLGKKRKTYRQKRNYNKVLILSGMILSIFTIINITKYIEDVYMGKNIENTKIEFYMDIADKAGKQNVQIDWKELLAIDMVRYNEDLSNVKKKDTLELAETFVIKTKDKSGESEYKIKKTKDVLSEIGFTTEQVAKVDKYRYKIRNLTLVNSNFNDDSKEIIFIKKIEKNAIENYDKFNILPSITIAQCILESGWGESKLSKDSNNLFGIKADSRWNGESISVSTTENYNDKIVDSFRVYNSQRESIKDHGQFLYDNKRYREYGLFDAAHYTTQAQALEDAGYSTKKNEKNEKIYADMLINIIRKYSLQSIDSKVQTID